MPERELRVVTYNVRALRDSARGVAEVLARLDPDVVLLQEAPRFLRWRSRLAALAREAGLFVACGGGTAAGVAVLTNLRVDVDQVWEHQLSWERGLHRRAVAAAALRLAGTPFLAASVHLGLQAGQRSRHVYEIQSVIAGLLEQRAEPLAVVVGGDLNDTPGTPVWELFERGGLRDAWSLAPDGSGDTYPSGEAVKRIDGILVDEHVRVLGAGVPVELPPRLLAAATDHRPVLARLDLSA